MNLASVFSPLFYTDSGVNLFPEPLVPQGTRKKKCIEIYSLVNKRGFFESMVSQNQNQFSELALLRKTLTLLGKSI